MSKDDQNDQNTHSLQRNRLGASKCAGQDGTRLLSFESRLDAFLELSKSNLSEAAGRSPAPLADRFIDIA